MAHEHKSWMTEALALAENARAQDEVPVGALVMQGALRLGQGYNQNIREKDPTAHAEVVALRDACLYADNYRLPDATIYVTLEPCLMCYMAIVQARLNTLVFGASDPKGGFRQFLDQDALAKLNHQPRIISGIMAEEASALISNFFREKRARGKRKWLKETS